MGRTVAELLSAMTSAEFTAWLAFDEVEPIGEGRTNLGLAQLAALLANINRNAERQPEPFETRDFMPLRWAPPRHPEPAAGSDEGMDPAEAARFQGFLMTRAALDGEMHGHG